jgi:hypothetical protein
MKQFKVSTDTLRGICAGLAISAALAACARDPDDIGPDADSGDDIGPGAGLDLWTRVQRPPYQAAALSLTHRVLEVVPEATGDILLEAELRWRDHAAGAIEPQVSFSLATDASETVLAQVFAREGRLRTRADLAITDRLEIGAWYRVVVAIGEGPARPVQVRILDADNVELWRSCESGRCPSVRLDPAELDSLRLAIAVDDLREGLGQIELRNIALKPSP